MKRREKHDGVPGNECPYCNARWDERGRKKEFTLISDMRTIANLGEPQCVSIQFEMYKTHAGERASTSDASLVGRVC